MAVVLWPESLGVLWVEGTYQETDADNVLRTQNDAGPPKARRRSTAARGQIAGQMVFTPEQKAVLQDFFNNTLSNGVFGFRMRGLEVDDLVCYFSKPPQYVPKTILVGSGEAEIQWRVNLQLEYDAT